MNEQTQFNGRRNLLVEYLAQCRRYAQAVNAGQDELAKKIRENMHRYDNTLGLELVVSNSGSERDE
ncbi:MAG: hypothetical protein MUF61_01485 [archaeon]|jgi:hypothetical protein|nr:hypothetical protein [archaeon]